LFPKERGVGRADDRKVLSEDHLCYQERAAMGRCTV
jgi:hypothetical protein